MSESVQAESDVVIAYVNQPYSPSTAIGGDTVIVAALTQDAKSVYVPVTAPLGAWVENVLTVHDERDEKEGLAIIAADIRDGRCSKHVVSTQWLVYEIDGKLSVSETEKILEALPYGSILYTTHNHLRESQAITYNTFVKSGIPDMATFCAQHKRYNHLRNVRIKGDGKTRKIKEWGKRVEVIDILHDPESKMRIVFPLASPIPVKERGLEHFKRVYRAHGGAVFGEGVYSFESCNPARIHFLGSHKPGALYSLAHFNAPALDWQTIELLPIEERKPTANSPTASAGELSHVLSFIPPDVDRGEWVKCLAAIFYETKGIEAGRDIAHVWSGGDPRYSFWETESILDSFSLGYEKPSTIGSLMYFAKKYSPDAYKPYRRPILLIPDQHRDIGTL